MTKFDAFDPRPFLSRTGGPFAAIKRQVDTLESGRGFTVNVAAPHIPDPLLDLLCRNRLTSSLDRGADGAWQVKFWRD